jgi:F-type H+-transporting ATPase subunit gamma
MATIREIKRRIGAVKSTRKITRAMQLVAAAKLRRAQENIIKLRPYAKGFERLISEVTAAIPSSSHPLLAEHGGKNASLLVLVTGDSGLCGGFNANTIKAARNIIAEQAETGRTEIYCIGRKGRDFFNRTGATIAGSTVNVFNRLSFADAARAVSDITGLYRSGAYDRVDVLYNEFGSAIRQVLTKKQFLPFIPAEQEKGAAPIDYLFEPDLESLLDILIPRSLEVQVWRIMLESYASEMGAKMTAMDAATENAEELLSSLTIVYNRARQSLITRELAELVGGAESLG